MTIRITSFSADDTISQDMICLAYSNTSKGFRPIRLKWMFAAILAFEERGGKTLNKSFDGDFFILLDREGKGFTVWDALS